MKRSREVAKTYVESDSSSDEENPQNKKLSPESAATSTNKDSKLKVTDDSSSSDSDIENYLKRPDKLDLDSDFFKLSSKQNAETSKETVPDFNKIENEIFAGVTRLSESDSDSDLNSDNDFQKKKKSPVKRKPQSQPKNVKKKGLKNSKPDKSKLNLSHGKIIESDSESNKNNEKKSKKKEKKSDVAGSAHSFNQLQEYTKKIEEAKKFVEIYKAKKQAAENKTDILNLLAAGEGLTTSEQKLDPADLHSSDFDSCESEQEGWEEIKQKEDQEEDKSDVPKKNVEITVSMPGALKKKKGSVDLLAAMKRRLNRIRKENQVVIHKVHLLCWIAHGNYLNAAINSTETLGMALSLLPSEQCYPSERTDLSYLEQIVSWYKRTVKCVDKSVPNDLPLDKLLQMQITQKEAYNKKMLVLIFVAIFRSLGIQCRLVISLQPEPLRPPTSELHDLGTKHEQGKEEKQKKLPKDVKSEIPTAACKPNLSKLKSQNPSKTKVVAANNGKRETKTLNEKEDNKQKAKGKDDIKNINTPNVESDNSNQKEIQSNKNNKKQDNKPSNKLEVRKSTTRSKNLGSKILTNVKNQRDSSSLKQSKSTECLKVTPNKLPKSKETKKPSSTKHVLKIPRTGRRSKSSESIKSDTPETIEKNYGFKGFTKDELKVPETVRRSKSTETVSSDTLDKPKSAKKNTRTSNAATKKTLELPKLEKKRSKSSETKPTSSKDKADTTNTRRKTRSVSNLNENAKKSNKNKQTGLLEVPKKTSTTRRSKSTDSIKSNASDTSVKSTRSAKSDKSMKSEKTKRVIKVKTPVCLKRVSQVDKLMYFSDTDESFGNHSKVPQVDGRFDETTTPMYLNVTFSAFPEDNETPDFMLKEDNWQLPSLHKDKDSSYKSDLKPLKGLDLNDINSEEDEDFVSLSIPQLDGPSVTVSKAKHKPNLSKLKQPTETGKIKKAEAQQLVQKKTSATKQLDVKNDIMNLIKGRIAEQKQVDKSRMVHKRRSYYVSDSDSDFAPEPIKKKYHDSEDEVIPKNKVKKRIPSKSALLAQETEEKKKKIGNDFWVEVFLEAEEKWICADLVYGQVHCVKEVFKRATQPVSYVLAWNNDNSIKDVTQRYCENFNTVTRKLRTDAKWWAESIKPYMGKQTARDKEEDNDLARQQLDQPLPKSIAEYKNHPLYVLKRHLLKFEALYPPEPPTLGFIRGEAVYPRGCVFTLHSRDIWLKQAKVVRLGEQPYKIVKARPKWDKLSNSLINDQMLEIFGPWQVDDYVPPNAENGKIPRNAFGNVDLFKPCMLPGGCVHLKLPGLNRVAKKLNIDCVAAIVGFDFHSGWSVPRYEGYVVCKEFEDTMISAWEEEQIEIERKELEKVEKRVYGNWKKLIKGLLIRERLKARYDFGEPSGSGSSKNKNKRSKGPTLCTKKRRIHQNSESDSN